MKIKRRTFIAGVAGLAGTSLFTPAIGQTKKLRFGVGPLLPNPEDTKKAYTPVFAHLAKELGVDFELATTTDWAGMAVAMGSGQLDVAWMGPWGYIIANAATNCQAVATVKYDDKPIYYAISSRGRISGCPSFPTTPRACPSRSPMLARRRAG